MIDDIPLRTIAIILLFACCISACEIEGGVAKPTIPPATPTVDQSIAPTAMPTSVAVANALAARRDTWVIGLLDQPPDLYPYPISAATRRSLAPISELLFPSPILAYNYGYTNTGVLERIPSLENGDARLKQAAVYLDAAGNITTTVTTIITQVNQLEVTFHWNPNLRWSDGTPVTAGDSVFAYEHAKVASPGDDALLLLSQIESYTAVDEHTTQALLKPNVSGWTYFLSYWTPLPRHILQSVDPATIHTSAFAKQPIGYGPYMIDTILPGEIRMVANPFYGGPQPAAKRLTIAFLRDLDVVRANIANGNLDLAITDRLTQEQLAILNRVPANTIDVRYLPNPIWEHIDFNLDVPTLQDIRIRRAIAFGTNRKRMAEAVYGDGDRTPILDSWVLPGQSEVAPADQLTRYPYDPEQARKLLAEAGYTDIDKDGIRSSQGVTLTFQLFTSEGPLRAQIAENFKEDMQAIGIGIDLVTLSTVDLFAATGPLFQRQFELALYAWIATPDPGGLQLWSCLAVPSETNNWTGDNFAGWCFRDADRAIREAVTTLDLPKRQAAYLKQQQLWTQELPSLPLFQRVSATLSAPGIIGIQPDALAPITWNVTAWRRKA
ncbi:MAG: peptide ABC transporter substrate-binding protein [Roseiflexaceae bacterium]|nr:peptide ABC transporter substrate-binding protein [Roseiflexaceae bacterium]